MPRKNREQIASKSDQSLVALLLIDVINDFEFPGGKALVGPATKISQNLANLKARAKAVGIPVVYVNDNFGKWRSDFKKLVDNCLDRDGLGKPIVEQLIPEPDDYFVLKPRHSAFHETPLDLLLKHLGVKILILMGLTTDSCILATATAAHMLEYELIVPRDCVASSSEAQKRHALKIVEETLNGRTTRGRDLKLHVLVRGSLPQRPRRKLK